MQVLRFITNLITLYTIMNLHEQTFTVQKISDYSEKLLEEKIVLTAAKIANRNGTSNLVGRITQAHWKQAIDSYVKNNPDSAFPSEGYIIEYLQPENSSNEVLNERARQLRQEAKNAELYNLASSTDSRSVFISAIEDLEHPNF
jgi:hypothetical protein